MKSIFSSAVSPGYDALIAYGGISRIYLYDTQSHDHITTLGGHSGPVMSLAVINEMNISNNTLENDDCSLLISGGEDKKIIVWRLDSFQLFRTLLGHGSAVTCLSVVADVPPYTPILVSASRDRTIRIWRVLDGIQINKLTDASLPINSMSVSNRVTATGAWLVAATNSKTVYVWNFSMIMNWERRKNFVLALSGSGLLTNNTKYRLQLHANHSNFNSDTSLSNGVLDHPVHETAPILCKEYTSLDMPYDEVHITNMGSDSSDKANNDVSHQDLGDRLSAEARVNDCRVELIDEEKEIMYIKLVNNRRPVIVGLSSLHLCRQICSFL
eukprot:CAMPEP_0182420602 /NCGR_PEP_ID=MMETSP1167-20130531/5522_1 /TAXON_ID=2988 /ORGANISM="Mallomonas Sp, Strain CCMP3275" /LENGTH=326 /DNA_ID=CAMNT_0024596773 /DNA_START=486 /DNA_END=1469 /DNA_ORIENTATION=+